MAGARVWSSDAMESGPLGGTLVELVARLHRRETIEDVMPSDFVPELFLRAVVRADDPAVSLEDSARAQRLLNKRTAEASALCVCSGSARARDEVEFEAWIAEARENMEPGLGDEFLVDAVRRLLNKEQFVDCHRALKALKDVVSTGRAVSAPEDDTLRPELEEDDAALTKFWQILLAADGDRPGKDRLRVFATLAESRAFPACTCTQYGSDARQPSADAVRGYYIRLMAGRDWRAAEAIAEFPQTYRVIQEAIAAAAAKTAASPGLESARDLH
jgi:hypothetical protein